MKEILEQKLAQLHIDEKQTEANLYAIRGAIDVVKQLIESEKENLENKKTND